MSVLAQVMVGGWEDFDYLSSNEVFPRPSSDNCFIPNLPQPRTGPSISLLSGGRVVICGGHNGTEYLDSCISWVTGDNDWTYYYTMK